MPTKRPDSSATNVARSDPEAPPAARSCQADSGNACSRARVEPKAIGASARARRRSARSRRPSSVRTRRISTGGPSDLKRSLARHLLDPEVEPARMQPEPLDAGSGGHHLHFMVHEDPGCIRDDQALGATVQFGALGAVAYL